MPVRVRLFPINLRGSASLSVIEFLDLVKIAIGPPKHVQRLRKKCSSMTLNFRFVSLYCALNSLPNLCGRVVKSFVSFWDFC